MPSGGGRGGVPEAREGFRTSLGSGGRNRGMRASILWYQHRRILRVLLILASWDPSQLRHEWICSSIGQGYCWNEVVNTHGTRPVLTHGPVFYSVYRTSIYVDSFGPLINYITISAVLFPTVTSYRASSKEDVKMQARAPYLQISLLTKDN
jgi:hypothetical protein